MRTRTQHVTQAIAWEIAAILWMVVEAVLSLGAGYEAHSLALTGFGMDSLIELVSASILVWRLRIEARGADDHAVDRAEVKAARCRRALRTALALFNRRGPLGTDHAKDRAPKSGRNHRDDHFWCSHGSVYPPKNGGWGWHYRARHCRRMLQKIGPVPVCVHGLGGIRRHTGCMGLRVDMDGPCRRSLHCLLGGPRSLGSIRRSAGNRGPGSSIGRLWSPSIDSAEIVR